MENNGKQRRLGWNQHPRPQVFSVVQSLAQKPANMSQPAEAHKQQHGRSLPPTPFKVKDKANYNKTS